MNFRVFSVLSSSVLAMAMISGCSAQDGTLAEESVGTASSELGFRTWRTDSATQCTVGGQQMHCCPGFQQGFLNEAVIGMSGNTFRCAQISNANFNAPFASTTQRTIGGVTGLACPPGSVMVGNFGASKLACVNVGPTTERAASSTSGSWAQCSPTNLPQPNTFFGGEAMVGFKVGAQGGVFRFFCAN